MAQGWLDASLYPDEPAPRSLESLEGRVDFLARLCAAWDFGLLPDAPALVEVARPDWREAVDRCRLLTSPSYHLLRELHGLPAVEFLGSIPAFILEDPSLQHV